MSFFKNKQNNPDFGHLAAIISGVKELEDLKAIRLENDKVYLFKDFLFDRKKAKNWFKNIYLVSRFRENISKGQKLYFIDIETNSQLGYFLESAHLNF